MHTYAQASHARHRGTTQPETADEKRRRLHREAADAVKHHKAALRDAKARYLEYDRAMQDATEIAHSASDTAETDISATDAAEDGTAATGAT